MPPRCVTIAGISRPPKSDRWKRMPESAGEGFNERVTLLPEWRPIPVHDTGRRRVRWTLMTSQMTAGTAAQNSASRLPPGRSGGDGFLYFFFFFFFWVDVED